MKIRSAFVTAALLTSLSVVAAGCSTIGTDDVAGEPGDAGGSSETGDSAPEGPTQVVLVTHDSFSLPKPLIAAFESESGYDVVQRPSGDAGEVTSRLVLTKDSPTGDVAFGVDNAFAGRALEAGVFTPYDVPLPAGAEAYRLASDAEQTLAPVDTGNVCVNVDLAWFREEGLAPPATLADLTDPAYRGLFVTPGATTSSPGFAFLLATIAAYGEDWPGYWEDLLANDARIVRGWEDAYFVDFTAGGGENASRPIVVSYDSSPAFTVDKQTGRTTTRALLPTCTRQVEYAGVLAGADNEQGAQALVEFLLSRPVQAALPTSMFVFPVRGDVALPPDWARFAERPTRTLDVPAEDVEANRDDWLTEWTDLTSR